MKKLISILLIISLLICSAFITVSKAEDSNNTDNLNYKEVVVVNKNLETQEETLETIKYIDDNNSIGKTLHNRELNVETNIGNSIDPQAIIGDDNRVFLSPALRPYSAVCYITAYYADCSTSTGSGFLIDDNVAVTVAHMAKGAVSIEVIPAKWYQDQRYGTTWAKNVVTHNSYDVNNYTTEYDWAILKLNDRIGQKTGYFNVVRYEDYTRLDGETVITAGYPTDLDDGQCAYRCTGTAFNTTELTFEHTADIWYGNSGGPMIRKSDMLVVGIQSGHNLGVPTNYATRVDNQLFNIMVNIINED